MKKKTKKQVAVPPEYPVPVYRNAKAKEFFQGVASGVHLFTRTSPDKDYSIREFEFHSDAEEALLKLRMKNFKKGFRVDRTDWPKPQEAKGWSGFREKFERKKKVLEKHPDVLITHYRIGRPAGVRKIAEFEEYMGYPLPPDLRSFYRNFNGIVLRWVNVKNPTIEDERETLKRNPDINRFVTDYFYPPECIHVPPVEELLRARDHGNYLDDLGRETAVLCFRLDWNNMYSGNLILRFEPGTGKPLYLCNSDHMAELWARDFNSFKDYANKVFLKKWTTREIDDAQYGE